MIAFPLRSVAGALALTAASLLAACSGDSDAHRLVSTAGPTHPIVVFPDSPDRTSTTALLSSPGAKQAGIDGRVLTVTSFDGARVVADQLTLNYKGDLGIRGSIRARGSISTVSHRSAKTDITPFGEDPLALLDRTAIVTYRYKGEDRSVGRHIGFIAEDTPPELSGPQHDQYDVTNTVAVNVAATKRLQQRLETLEKQVATLQAELARRPRAETATAK